MEIFQKTDRNIYMRVGYFKYCSIFEKLFKNDKYFWRSYCWLKVLNVWKVLEISNKYSRICISLTRSEVYAHLQDFKFKIVKMKISFNYSRTFHTYPRLNSQDALRTSFDNFIYNSNRIHPVLSPINIIYLGMYIKTDKSQKKIHSIIRNVSTISLISNRLSYKIR